MRFTAKLQTFHTDREWSCEPLGTVGIFIFLRCLLVLRYCQRDLVL